VLQIDPDTSRVIGRVEVEGPLFGLAFTRGQLWLGTLQGLVRIDPQTRTVVETIELESFEPQGLTPDGDVLWISSGLQGTVLRFDTRTGRVLDRFDVDDDSLFGGIVVGDSYWVSGNNGTVFRLDARTGDVVDQLDLVGFGPMPADGDLWTVDFLSNTVFRLDERAD
jgi:glutamine cyclotransferase